MWWLMCVFFFFVSRAVFRSSSAVPKCAFHIYFGASQMVRGASPNKVDPLETAFWRGEGENQLCDGGAISSTSVFRECEVL